MDANQIESELKSHNLIKEATSYYVKMYDAIVNAVTQDMNFRHQKEIATLEKQHQQQYLELDKKYEEQLKQLDKSQKSQSSSMGNLSMFQSLSKAVTDKDKEIEILQLQLKSLKKQLTDRSKSNDITLSSPAKIIHLKTAIVPSISVPSTPATPIPTQPVETPMHPLETPVHPLETQIEAPAQSANQDPPPPIKSLIKIKYKGTIYYQDKAPNADEEYKVYECSNNQAGQVVGVKNKEGKYIMG